MPSGKQFVSIKATTQRARDDFWSIGREVGYFKYGGGRTKTATIKNYRNHIVIPWKTFPTLFVLIAMLEGTADDCHDVNWQSLEEKRTFWDTAQENDKFW